jgi:hypothetical protein
MDQSVNVFVSFFTIPPGLSITLFLIGIGISIVLIALWLAAYWPPFLRKPWLWLALVGTGIFTVICYSFIQIPLQQLAGWIIQQVWSTDFINRNILFTAIPSLLVASLVQVGAMLIPVVAYWWRKNRAIEPKFAIMLGAVCGAGFGLFESQWILNAAFAMGWSTSLFQSQGVAAIFPFVERFFIVGFHAATIAFAAYGLARGFGWQYYLLAALIDTVLNYGVLLFNVKFFNYIQVEIFIIIWALLITALMLWLRWRRPNKEKSDQIVSYWNKKSDKFNKLTK